MTLDQVIATMSQRIAQMEGFYMSESQARSQKSGFPTLAQKNNNPGNLRSWGSNPIVNGYAQFPSADAGWAALRQQIRLNVNRGFTFLEFFGGKPGVYSGYAPAADSNWPVNYANFVASPFGVPASTRILDLVGAAATPPPVTVPPPVATPPPVTEPPANPPKDLPSPAVAGPVLLQPEQSAVSQSGPRSLSDLWRSIWFLIKAWLNGSQNP